MKAKNEIGKDKNDKVYYDKMVEFMALYDKQATKQNVRRESLFRQLASEPEEHTDLVQKVTSLQDLNSRFQENERLTKEILRIASQAPSEVTQSIHRILDTKSKYLNLTNLKNFLENENNINRNIEDSAL